MGTRIPRNNSQYTICTPGTIHIISFVCFWRDSPPVGQGLLIHEVSRSHTTTHHTWQDSLGRGIGSSQTTLPDNTHNRQTFMSPVGFEPTTSAGERPQTYALDRSAIGTGTCSFTLINSRVAMAL